MKAKRRKLEGKELKEGGKGDSNDNGHVGGTSEEEVNKKKTIYADKKSDGPANKDDKKSDLLGEKKGTKGSSPNIRVSNQNSNLEDVQIEGAEDYNLSGDHFDEEGEGFVDLPPPSYDPIDVSMMLVENQFPTTADPDVIDLISEPSRSQGRARRKKRKAKRRSSAGGGAGGRGSTEVGLGEDGEVGGDFGEEGEDDVDFGEEEADFGDEGEGRRGYLCILDDFF